MAMIMNVSIMILMYFCYGKRHAMILIMLLIEMMIIVAMMTFIEISTARMVATVIRILDMLIIVIIAINSVHDIVNDWTVRSVC